ncbi:MAG: YdcF family protein [Planctomycetaceae bacterium]|nr:YdcF family protein [Planctomycetaceae bacterium]
MTISKRTATAAACAGGVAAVLGATAFLNGQAVLEKLVQRLATPVALIWIALAIQSGFLLARGRRAACLWSSGLWLTLTLLGNGPLVQWAYTSQERPYADIDMRNQAPYDVLIVLGGGAVGGGQRRPQLSPAGDRIVLAAQLYHAGQVQRLVCTGERIAALNPDDLDPAEQAELILRSLGVPETAIVRSGGRNTSEELQQVAERGLASGRAGLVTSAWHMPRALQLAQRVGLALVPAPADFQGAPPGPAPVSTFGEQVLSGIPTAESLGATGKLLKERVAILIGR